MQQMEQYLLDGNKLVLDPMLIYLDIEEPGLLYTFWDFCETLDDALFYTTTEAIEILRDLIEQYKELR